MPSSSRFVHPAVLLPVFLFLLAVPVRAELQLWLIAGTTDPLSWQPLATVQPRQIRSGETLDFSQFAALRENDLLDLRFEIRNTDAPGAPLAYISNLRVIPSPGTAFHALWNQPPQDLAGGAKHIFEIRFLPPKPQSYEATLSFSAGFFVYLRGSANGRTVMHEIDTAGQRQLINGSTSDFGDVRVGSSSIKNYRITNTTNAGLMISPPVLTTAGGAFVLVQAPTTPVTVPVNGLYEFKVEFRPTQTGLVAGSLSVDGRTIQLVGKGLAAETPDFRLLPAASDVDSASQSSVRIELVSPATQALNGTLTLIFEKDIGDLPDDTNIRFIANSARTLPFTIPAGATKAQFGGGSSEQAIFQTGAASGKIRLVATLAPWEHSAQINIRSDAPKLASGSLQRSAGTLTVSVSGFDNTRSATTASFRFFTADGQMLGGSPIEATVGEVFSTFFRASSTGGLFAMRAAFPIQGDVNVIDRVEVQLRNKIGISLTYTAR